MSEQSTQTNEKSIRRSEKSTGTMLQFRSKRHSAGKAYHKRLEKIYSTIIAPGSRVLEIGCGEGDLLHSLDPGYGVGIDLSEIMIKKAKEKYAHLRFEVMDAHLAGELNETFDYIILSDLSTTYGMFKRY